MSTTTLTFKYRVGGVLTDVTSVVLRNSTGTFGVKRLDNNALVIAAGTAMTHAGTGVYQYTFTDPAAGLVYTWVAEFVVGSDTDHAQFSAVGGGEEDPDAYMAVADADAMAATLPPSMLASYLAASSSARGALLLQASIDVDEGMRYQGRKYDFGQERQFPRVAHEPSTRVLPNTGATPVGTAWGETVWDIDPATNQPVVPRNVLMAVLWQANYLAGPGGAAGGRLDQQHEGVRDVMTGPLRETYDARAAGVRTGLCRRSFQLVKRYQLASGKYI